MKSKYLLMLTILTLVPVTVEAAKYGKSRAGKADFSFKINYLESMDLKGENGSGVDITDDFGYGFEFGFNYSEQLNLSYELLYNQPGYKATIVSEEPISREFTTRNKLDILNSQFNVTYYFTPNAITPFISGGLGWSYVDSNVPTGSFEQICYWDPWYGYVCAGVQDTYDGYNFTYNAKAGVRMDLDGGLFVVGSYNNVWYDFDHAKTLSTGVFQIQIGMKY